MILLNLFDPIHQRFSPRHSLSQTITTTLTTGGGKPMSTETKTDTDIAKIAAAEASLTAKYGSKIVPGSVRRAKTKAEKDTYGSKLLCEIRTVGLDGKPDGKTRVVATSDVWQIHHQPDVKEALRKAQRQEKAAKKREAKKVSQPKAEEKAPKGETKEERKARLAAAEK